MPPASRRRWRMALDAGAEEIRKYVRTMCREGCDIIKVNVSGNGQGGPFHSNYFRASD